MKKFQVCFGAYVDIEAEDKYEAEQRARDVLRHEHTEDFLDIDADPICVVEVDENGDPVL